jgi:hypothetical protein
MAKLKIVQEGLPFGTIDTTAMPEYKRIRIIAPKPQGEAYV